MSSTSSTITLNKDLVDSVLRLLEIYPNCDTCKANNYACVPSQWVQGYKKCDKTRPWGTPGTIGANGDIIPLFSNGSLATGGSGKTGSQCVGTNEANAVILSHQQEMNRILNDETARLDEQQKRQSTELTTETRLIELNENRRKRNLQWIYIVCIWIVSFALVLVIIFLCSFLPSWLPCNILISIVLSIAGIMTIYLYFDMNRKDPNDFDKLDLAPPDISFNSQFITSSPFDLSFSTCIGKDCCSSIAGTTWDQGNAVCIREGFETGKENDHIGIYLFNSIGLAMPNTAYEIGYNHYR